VHWVSDMRDIYTIPFQGGWVECRTGLDAVDVKLADRVLSGREEVTPIELQRLANVLEKHGQPFAAERLRSSLGQQTTAG
jgi:hypothetical protein